MQNECLSFGGISYYNFRIVFFFIIYLFETLTASTKDLFVLNEVEETKLLNN